MDIEKRLEMSYYKTIATINEEHKIYIVQNINDRHIYVKKILDVYNLDVYQYLQKHHVKGTPYIYFIYEEEGSLIIIEEYVSGQTLEELLSRKYPFSVDEIKDITVQLCTILGKLHSCNPAIIHRDLKPSNIIRKEDGQVVLLDLNAAKHFSSDKFEDTMLLGTKGYAAPEQYGFGTSNSQTDIYALGMVINTLLYGKYTPVPYPACELTPVITKCIQLNPKERYKSVYDIRRQINVPTSDAIEEPKAWKSYLPPGYRQMKPLNVILATLGYIFIFWLSLTLEIKDSTIFNLFLERIFCLLMFLGIVLISCDYLGVQKNFSLCKSGNVLIRILGICLFDFIYVFALLSVMAIILSIFS